MSKIDALFITPRSRLEVYQGLSNDYAAIEPPVWSSLIANYLIKKNYNVKILDAEAENLTHEETAEKILKINPKLAVLAGCKMCQQVVKCIKKIWHNIFLS